MSERIEITIDEQGHLVLPSPLPRQLGLSPGMTLVVEPEATGAVHLRIRDEDPRLVDKGGVLVVRAQASDDLETVVDRERSRRTADLLLRQTDG